MKHIVLLLLILPYLSPAQSLDWQIQDKNFEPGDTVAAQFQAFGFDSLVAYQFAMQFDTGALQFIGATFQPGSPVTADDFGFSKSHLGILRHLWTDPYSETVQAGTHLFSLIFRAKQSGELHNKLWLSPCCLYPPLNPMSYRWPDSYQALTVAFVSPASATNAGMQKSQVRIYPNPVTDALTIEAPAPVEVQIYNAAGQRTHHRRAVLTGEFWNLSKGANVVRVTDGKETVTQTVIKN